MTRRTDLTPLEQAFARHYAVSKNATEAAVKAGYSPKAAAQMGSRTLARPRVRAEVNRLVSMGKQQVESLLRDAAVTMNRQTAVNRGTIPDQLRAEMDAEAVAILTRATVLAIVYENLEIASGRKPAIIRKTVDGKQVIEEVWSRNSSAANGAAQILLNAPELNQSAGSDATPPDKIKEMAEAMKRFADKP